VLMGVVALFGLVIPMMAYVLNRWVLFCLFFLHTLTALAE
jgi:hypothetical protein